ncbi:pH-response regulator protein [Scheffersomyces xylosifermentans]|uniref:pH-response regulator protein n=1 Tax=Scheffersomyces xylosifermentans TaxID=1304137 RepID=UPI00315DF6E6
MRRAVSKIIPTPKFLSNNSSGESTLSSNFRIDFNSVAEFYIQLDKPHKTWLPGDEVPGQIILISKKNVANIVITLSLIGYVKINASSHSKLRPIKQTLFDHTIKIYGDSLSAQDESGELANGLYKGEHVFPFIVKLPNKRVFTSIDFGKGSINYILRASIGNSSSYTTTSASSQNQSPPATQASSNSHLSSSSLFAKTKGLKILHNPTYTSEKLINLVNPIDVTALPAPKPKRLILKDPRGQNAKKLSRTQSSTSTINTINTMNTYSTLSSNNSENNDNSNTTNTITFANTNSSTNPNTASPFPTIDKANFQKPETIKVSLEIPQRGYLRGELIPIKLSINHLKKIQDLNGIIITLVRVCRLDNGAESFFESFRKDLQQSVIPLYVDPVTFQSEINTSLRVPADAFPTIVGCPLVSFQYFIEVLVNLSGKSLALDNDGVPEHHPQTKVVDDPTTFNFNFNTPSLASQHHKERSGFINTDKFKRSKKFLQLTTEVVIGTHRSSSNETERENVNGAINDMTIADQPSLSRRSSSSVSNNSPNNGSVLPQASMSLSGQPSYINAIPETAAMNSFQSPPYFENQSGYPPVPTNFNSIPNYNELNGTSALGTAVASGQDREISEKERMRAHESSLLPSAPPLDGVEEDDANGIDNDDDLYHDPNAPTGASAEVDDDQYSAIDFVPNYNSSNNDRLLSEGRHAGTVNGERENDNVSHA